MAARAQASKTRQRIGLEQTGDSLMTPQSNMRSAAPQNGPPPKAVVGPQVQAMQGGATQAGPQGGPAITPDMVPQDKHDLMDQMIQAHMGQQGAQAPQPAPPEQETPGVRQAPSLPQGQPPMSGGSKLPIAEFMSVMGRPPTPQELLHMGARAHLQARLGREPAPEEVQQLMSPPQQPQEAAPNG